jgi:hypothetical protein
MEPFRATRPRRLAVFAAGILTLVLLIPPAPSVARRAPHAPGRPSWFYGDPRTARRFPDAIYPPAASFPSWGGVTGCPSLEGVQDPGPQAGKHALRAVLRFKATYPNRRVSDRALWPVLPADTARQQDRRKPLSVSKVRSFAAEQSDYASLLRHGCGRRTVKLSWTIVLCTNVPKAECYPASLVHYMLIRRRGHWLVWFGYP